MLQFSKVYMAILSVLSVLYSTLLQVLHNDCQYMLINMLQFSPFYTASLSAHYFLCRSSPSFTWLHSECILVCVAAVPVLHDHSQYILFLVPQFSKFYMTALWLHIGLCCSYPSFAWPLSMLSVLCAAALQVLHDHSEYIPFSVSQFSKFDMTSVGTYCALCRSSPSFTCQLLLHTVLCVAVLQVLLDHAWCLLFFVSLFSKFYMTTLGANCSLCRRSPSFTRPLLVKTVLCVAVFQVLHDLS